MTPEVAVFLLELLQAQEVQVGHPSFREVTRLIIQAQDELGRFLVATEETAEE